MCLSLYLSKCVGGLEFQIELGNSDYECMLLSADLLPPSQHQDIQAICRLIRCFIRIKRHAVYRWGLSIQNQHNSCRLWCSICHGPVQCCSRRIKIDRKLRGDGRPIERESLPCLSTNRSQFSACSERESILHNDRDSTDIVAVIPRQHVVSPFVLTCGIKPLGEFFHGVVSGDML